MSTIIWPLLTLSLTLGGTPAEAVAQSERDIPVVRSTEVLVVGGTLGAVATAVEAARRGRDVMLVAPRTYLGEDLCATLALWLDEDERPAEPLTRRVFADARVTTPLRVKQTLEAALLEAKVGFLLASYPTDVLQDRDGQVAGVVIANRAGRQAILAKVIVDGTDGAAVAHMAGAAFRATADNDLTCCRRIVLGGQSDSRWQPVREVPAGLTVRGQEVSYYVYQRRLAADHLDPARFAEAQQQMRDHTYRTGQLRASERIEVLPGASIRGRKAAGQWSPDAPLDLGHFQPADIDRLFVLRGAADVPRQHVGSLLSPDAQEQLGNRVGRAAACVSAELPPPQDVHVAGSAAEELAGTGDVLEILTGLRPTNHVRQTVHSPATSVPVWARVNVVVIGGGTSGACAAIAAARRGASVLVVEFQEGLGGVGTVGLIGKPYHGLDRGFTAEVPFPGKEHNTEHKMEWFRRQIRTAGGQIWFGALGCGAYVEQGRLRGAVVASPAGRGVVVADVVVDATGNADIAVAAGAESMYGGDAQGIALQGTGLPWRPLANSYVNTDYLLVDESDMIDTWRAFVGMRLADEIEDYDVGPFIQARERRRIVGDHVLTYLDQIAGRTYPDSIVLSGSDYDSHGYPSESYFALIPHTDKTLKANHPAPGGTCYTPYRCLLPRGVEGLLVTGLGIGMQRDASAMVRMQKDMHNQGYAAGVAAAMAAESRCTPRAIDVDRLQQHLVDIGNLPQEVLQHGDSFPLPEAIVREAVWSFTDTGLSRNDRCQALAVILSHAGTARPTLREAFRQSTTSARVEYAKVLGFLGEREVVPVLLEALKQVDGWDAKIYQGNMAEYAHLPTPVDALIQALGYSGDPGTLPVLLQWLGRLDANVTLSHHRAVALALERLAHPAAAPPLAELLQQPGMSGHVMLGLEPLHNRNRQRRRRIGPLREIVLARALYRCGDHEGLGEQILEQYCADIRGLFARHAQAVLDSAKP